MLKNYDDKEINLKTNEIKKLTLDDQLKKVNSQIVSFNQTPEKVKNSFLQAITLNPELKKVQPQSALLSIARSMELGLDLDPRLSQVALIPYKQGLTGSIAQLQIMWKGYRQLVKDNLLGFKNLITFPVYEGDIKSWDISTGEMVWNESLWSTDFKEVLARKSKTPIGYMSAILLDEKIYGQKNFAYFMTIGEIKQWKIDYGSKTKINIDKYSRKTLAKIVIREYKHKIKWNIDKGRIIVNEALEKDQSATIDGTQTLYVENKEDNNVRKNKEKK